MRLATSGCLLESVRAYIVQKRDLINDSSDFYGTHPSLAALSFRDQLANDMKWFHSSSRASLEFTSNSRAVNLANTCGDAQLYPLRKSRKGFDGGFEPLQSKG